jgi:hypothetical protein
MDFKRHLETAWTLTLANIIPLIFMTLVMGVVSCFTLGVLAPVTLAGFMQAAILLVREGREPKIQDVFSQMRLFLPLLAFGLVSSIATMIGFAMLLLPGILVILALAFCCLYLVPLMTDKEMGLMDALKESYRMAMQKPVGDHILVAVLFLGINALGSSVVGIGVLFTCPLATLFLASVYLEKTGSVVRMV